jgi:hypothetical protein
MIKKKTFIPLFFLFTAQEISDIVEMFDGNVRGVQILGNNTCLSLQTSIEEDDDNLTTAHHRHLRKYSGISI